MTLSLIIPTYNEKGNLSTLVKRAHNCLSGYVDYEIIIVDDNSPDGTGELAEKMAQEYSIKVIHREGKKGLASAVVDGFKLARGEILGVMDADLQHPPEKIPELLTEISKGADVVIASRYVKKGGAEGLSFKRKIISIIAKFLIPILFPKIRVIKDPLSGFFLLKKEVIRNANLKPIGYKILLEILARGNYTQVVEIPYVFKERLSGRSNINFKEYINYLKHLYRLKKIRNKQDSFYKNF